MGKSISLTVQMNDPCNENWNDMQPIAQGPGRIQIAKPQFVKGIKSEVVIDFTGPGE